MRLGKENRKPLRPRATLDWHDVQRLALEALVAIETVRRWARGDRVGSLTNARITRACGKLGIKRELAS